jgi:hypothetical protein
MPKDLEQVSSSRSDSVKRFDGIVSQRVQYLHTPSPITRTIRMLRQMFSFVI